jgi:hypothetical protein
MRMIVLVMSPGVIFSNFAICAALWAGYKLVDTKYDMKFKQLILLLT